MATMTVTSQSTDITAYGSRLATLEVTGISMRNGQQTMLVPLNRLSQTMQQIHRQGGKIVSINTGVAAPAMPSPIVKSVEQVKSVEKSAAPAPKTPENEQELAMEEPSVQHKHSAKKKRK
jgi:CpcD/allophycocyanin linker domain